MTKNKHYILEGKEIKKVDFHTWSEWFENNENRRVKLTKHPSGWFVSTVFLGIDHSFGIGDKDLVFETMAFGTNSYSETRRWSTYTEAVRGHDDLVKEIKDQI